MGVLKGLPAKMDKFIKVVLRVYGVCSLLALFFSILGYIRFYQKGLDKLTTLDLHQRTMRPLQKLVIWERLNFPKISTPEPPRIVYYRDPTKLAKTSMATTTVATIKVTTTVTTTVATTATTIIEITKIATVDSTSTESSKKDGGIPKPVILKIMEDHGDKGGLFLLGTGIDKLQAPSHSWKRRTQLPVKLRNRVRMNAVEPSDMFEYISRHFKAYNFNDMHRIQECPFPIKNMSIPIHESVGGLIDDKPVLCGGLTRKKRQISH